MMNIDHYRWLELVRQQIVPTIEGGCVQLAGLAKRFSLRLPNDLNP
jgi:hypothetical protein